MGILIMNEIDNGKLPEEPILKAVRKQWGNAEVLGSALKKKLTAILRVSPMELRMSC